MSLTAKDRWHRLFSCHVEVYPGDTYVMGRVTVTVVGVELYPSRRQSTITTLVHDGRHGAGDVDVIRNTFETFCDWVLSVRAKKVNEWRPHDVDG